jgi:Flp pilus assembly protein TadD
MPDSTGAHPLVTANLGYLYLVQGDYSKADEYLRRAVSLDTGGEAILRVARWQGDRVIPDPTTHPTRFLPIYVAAHANLVTLALAQSQIEAAETLARQIVEEAPDDPLGYEMLGWVRRADGKFDETREAWEQAVEHTADPQARSILSEWLESLTA